MSDPWSLEARLADVGRGGLSLTSEPEPALWPRIADAIGVDALLALQAVVGLKPWLDGAELEAHITARAVQTCGITLDPFTVPLDTRFTVRVLPRASRHAPPETGREVTIDPEGEDPPDLIDGDVIDVGSYLVEHLALEVDPFPRHPDALFEPAADTAALSPFSALAVLKTPKAPH
jgi:hypothetical protein